MAKIKKVGFNFFRPVIETEDNKTKICDLKPFVEKIRGKYIKARESLEEEGNENQYKIIYSYKGEPARLADISIDIETQYYHLVFERLDYQVPSRTTLHGDSEALDLGDDEYIGIDVNVLYDPENHVLMIQRNRSSLGPLGIETFIRTMLLNNTDSEEKFNLAIISDGTAKKRAFKQSAYRKIQMKVTGVKAQGIVEKLTQNKNADVDTVEVIFSTRVEKSASLDEEFSKKILKEYLDDDNVETLKIRAREQEGGLIEPIDLIDHKLQLYTNFNFMGRRHLLPISVFQEMVQKYHVEDGGFKNKIPRM